MALVITRGELTSSQKFYSVIIIFALLFVELHSVSVDREHREKDHQQFISQMQTDFNATEQHFAQAINGESEVLKNVTGGDAFPALVPQPGNGLYIDGDTPDSEVIPLMLFNRGYYPLTGVSVSEVDESNFNKDLAVGLYGRPDDVVPEVASRGEAPLKILLHPKWEGEKPVPYFFFIRTQNGTYTEYLEVRKGSPYFAQRFWVTKQSPMPGLNQNQESGKIVEAHYNFSDDPKGDSPNDVHAPVRPLSSTPDRSSSQP
jgi:hypothetical protein